MGMKSFKLGLDAEEIRTKGAFSGHVEHLCSGAVYLCVVRGGCCLHNLQELGEGSGWNP